MLVFSFPKKRRKHEKLMVSRGFLLPFFEKNFKSSLDFDLHTT
jgi:hypothetical protein